MEFRVGALWPQPPVVVDVDDVDPSDTRVAIGGRFGWYPGSAEDRPRVRLDIGVDYAPVGSAEHFDVGLDSYARFEGHWVAIVPVVALECSFPTRPAHPSVVPAVSGPRRLPSGFPAPTLLPVNDRPHR